MCRHPAATTATIQMNERAQVGGLRDTVGCKNKFYDERFSFEHTDALIFSVWVWCEPSLHPQGCPSDQVKGVLSRLPPVSQKFAKYWICKARLMEQEGNLDVLPMFEEAVRVVLEVRHQWYSNIRDILDKGFVQHLILVFSFISVNLWCVLIIYSINISQKWDIHWIILSIRIQQYDRSVLLPRHKKKNRSVSHYNKIFSCYYDMRTVFKSRRWRPEQSTTQIYWFYSHRKLKKPANSHCRCWNQRILGCLIHYQNSW